VRLHVSRIRSSMIELPVRALVSSYADLQKGEHYRWSMTGVELTLHDICVGRGHSQPGCFESAARAHSCRRGWHCSRSQHLRSEKILAMFCLLSRSSRLSAVTISLYRLRLTHLSSDLTYDRLHRPSPLFRLRSECLILHIDFVSSLSDLVQRCAQILVF
jgi:hypothetical protein